MMRGARLLASALALSSRGYSQVDSISSCDTAAGICFSTYTVPQNGITVGIAIPENVTSAYDAILSISAPTNVTWAGFAWGGTMTYNPLTVGWPYQATSIVSSRLAFGLGLPTAYDDAQYDLMQGTTANATHWTIVARCKGCTSWQANDGSDYLLNGTGTVTFAWAQGENAVQDPSNNASAFNVHTNFGKWTHDLNAARSPGFAAYVAANIKSSTPAPPVAANGTSTSISGPTSSTTRPIPLVTGALIPATCAGAGSAAFPTALAAGWKATKVLGGLTSPRQLVLDSLGNMLMVQSGKGITIHTMSSDGCVTASKTLIALNTLNHGMVLSPDGKTLYASSMTTAFSWPYDASAQTVGARTTIITGMFNGGHSTRTLLIGAHAPNLLVVSHGSNGNFDMSSIDPAVARAVIKTFDLSKVPSAGYKYMSDGWLTGYGMRNEVGITLDGNNMLWGVENSGDQFTRTANGTAARDIHQNNPAEKLNYIGDITKPISTWFGYPTCFSIWQPSDFVDSVKKIGDNFVLAPNSTFNDSTCDIKMQAPSTLFMPHSAPIDSKFDANFTTMYVTLHGSWNRSPATGYKLVAIPFKKDTTGTYTPVAGRDTQTGYQDIFYNPNVEKCSGSGTSYSSGCFRPAGLVFDAGQRLYMTSDLSPNGELWILGKA